VIYVLDTDTLDHYHHENESVLQRVEAAGPASVYVSLPTRVEILHTRFEYLRKAANAEELSRAQDWLNESERLLDAWAILPFDEAAYVEFDQLRTMKSLRKIGRMDVLIACIALANRATLVSRNVRDFRLVPRLRVENWVD
jgi:tRNA(fMet)-specific endonuclease VapC